MKKNTYSKVLCVILSSLVLLSTSPFYAFATDVGFTRRKMSCETIAKVNELADNDKLDVWIWCNDIDLSSIERKTENICGFTRESISTVMPELPNGVEKALNSQPDSISGKISESDKELISQYVSDTSYVRNQIKDKKDYYNGTYRSLASEEYTRYNTALINDFDINSNDIIFKSSLTPSMIASLTKTQILALESNPKVLQIEYYEETEGEPPETPEEEEAKASTSSSTDEVKEIFNVNGDGVSVLMIDHDYVRDDYSNYNDIPVQYRDQIINIRNNNFYDHHQITQLASQNEDHANTVVHGLLSFADGITVYSVYFQNYWDIEWALTNETLSIDLISASVNQSNTERYDQAYVTRWYDALVSTCNVPFIAAGGNNMSTENGAEIPLTVSPGWGYNSISTGAYNPNINKMHNFRYNKLDNPNIVHYKPDVVMPSNRGTSLATPYLSGIAALILELNPNLSDVELMKTVIMSSCHEKAICYESSRDEAMEDGLTETQGAGKVNAYKAMCTALLGNYNKGSISSGTKTVGSFTPTQSGKVNVSLAWLRNNVFVPNSPPSSSNFTVLGPIHELELKVYNGSTLVGSSNKTNAGKQLVYFDAVGGVTYTIKVTKTDSDVATVDYAYAWSSKTDSYLDHVEIQGKTAKGQLLTANTKLYGQSENVPSGLLNFQWQKSTDKVNWTNISSATSQAYLLTNNDIGYYVRCNVSSKNPPFLGNSAVNAITSIKIVLFGDADSSGTLTVKDASKIRDYLNGESMTPEGQYAADVDGNNVVNVKDANLIQKRLAGLITAFPVE